MEQDYLRVALVWAKSSGLALTQAIMEIKQLACKREIKHCHLIFWLTKKYFYLVNVKRGQPEGLLEVPW